jgi:DDE family transposase
VVRAEIDTRRYPKAVEVSDAEMAALNLSRRAFHGDWNFTISPRARASTKKRID